MQGNKMDMELISKLRANFNKGLTKPLAYRQQQLSGLKQFLIQCEPLIEKALYEDLRKSAFETFATESNMLLSEIRLVQKNLHAWAKPEKVATPWLVKPGKSYILPEPYGVVLIIAPWNYPLQLCLSPLIGAIAAGNCVLIKPSEIAKATSQLLAEKLPLYLDEASIQVIQGGIDETTTLLQQPLDYIFYTGNHSVGRRIMEAAALHLTPITLELGGKMPLHS